MSEYSRELHHQLLGYRAFETRLNDRRVNLLEVNGVAMTDLGSVRINKIGELMLSDVELDTPPLLVSDYMVFISEIRNNPKSSEEALVKQTEYIVTADGEFSDPVQNYRIYPANQAENITVEAEIARLINDLNKKLISLENMDADPIEIANTKFHLSNANGELKKIQEENHMFSVAAYEYDKSEHERLMKKLGSLLLY